MTMQQNITIQRENELKQWVQRCFPEQSFVMEFAAADADFRRYFRVIFDDATTVICMDAPPDKMSIEPFMRVHDLFHAIRVPNILHADTSRGLMVLEDFGRVSYLTAMQHDSRTEVHKVLLLEAIDELVLLQSSSQTNVLPEYNKELLLRELQLFPDWFVAKELNQSLNFRQQKLWSETLAALLPVIECQPKVYVHRDFIVRNIMLTSERPGILDFQDAVYGPITYDLVSLLRDAFIEWEEEFVLDLVIRYWEKARIAQLPVSADFDQFYRDFEWMGIHRHLKVAGIFARLYYRDQKDKYRGEIPRFLNYLRRTSRRYHALSPLYTLLVDLVGDADLKTGFTF